jgi:hypothetical protein
VDTYPGAVTIQGPLIRYAGCPFTPNGYGTEARVALRYLHRAGYNLALQPRDSGPRLTQDKADAAVFGVMTNRAGAGRPNDGRGRCPPEKLGRLL